MANTDKSLGALSIVERFNSLHDSDRATIDSLLPDGRHGDVFVRQERVTLGLITALPIEFVAAQRALLAPRAEVTITEKRYAPDLRAPLNIQLYTYEKGGAALTIALTQVLQMGNNSAAVAATSLIYEFQELTDVLMVGIAGGIPSPLRKGDSDRKLIEDHVRLGDIFVADFPIIQYDMVKREPSRISNRSIPVSISPRLKRVIQFLKQQEVDDLFPWDLYVREVAGGRQGWARPAAATDVPKLYETPVSGPTVAVGDVVHPVRQPRRRAGKPMVHYGRIGSGNILMKDPAERDRLRAQEGIRAIEMEGSGVGDAAWSLAVGYGVVRGICDYCDPEKPDIWQRHAAVVAAAYSRSIIDVLLDEAALLVAQRSAPRAAVE